MLQTLSRGSVAVNKKRWAAYAAAGVASALAGAQSAEAEITWVVVGSPTGDINVGDTYVGFLGNTAFALYAYNNGSTALVNVIGGSVAGFTASSGMGNYNPYASNLSFGANISTANFGIASNTDVTLARGYGYFNSQFLNTGGYIAFQFNGGTQFGWARFSALTGPPLNEYVLEEFAYGMVSEAVTVGQVPEPTSLSLGLLALGAIGVMEHRRRKVAS